MKRIKRKLRRNPESYDQNYADGHQTGLAPPDEEISGGVDWASFEKKEWDPSSLFNPKVNAPVRKVDP